MEFDMLSLSRKLEITCPEGYCLCDVKTIELQVHLTILYLAKIKNASYQLLKCQGITLHHLQQIPCFALDTLILQ